MSHLQGLVVDKHNVVVMQALSASVRHRAAQIHPRGNRVSTRTGATVKGQVAEQGPFNLLLSSWKSSIVLVDGTCLPSRWGVHPW